MPAHCLPLSHRVLPQRVPEPDVDLSFLIFFFSSRRRHTRFKCDWSSDVCSSDLPNASSRASTCPLRTSRHAMMRLDNTKLSTTGHAEDTGGHGHGGSIRLALGFEPLCPPRSEERRVGKGVDLGGRRIIKKKNRVI